MRTVILLCMLGMALAQEGGEAAVDSVTSEAEGAASEGATTAPTWTQVPNGQSCPRAARSKVPADNLEDCKAKCSDGCAAIVWYSSVSPKDKNMQCQHASTCDPLHKSINPTVQTWIKESADGAEDEADAARYEAGKKHIADLKRTNDALEFLLNSLKETTTKLRVQHKEMAATASMKQSQQEQQNAALKEKLTTIQEITKEYREELEQFNKKTAEDQKLLKSELATATATLKSLKKQRALRQKRLDRIVAEIKKQESFIVKLEATVKQCKAAKQEEREKLLAAIKLTTEANAAIFSSIQSFETEIKEKEAEVDAAKEKLTADREAENAKIALVEKDVAAFKATSAKLCTAVEEASKKLLEKKAELKGKQAELQKATDVFIEEEATTMDLSHLKLAPKANALMAAPPCDQAGGYCVKADLLDGAVAEADERFVAVKGVFQGMCDTLSNLATKLKDDIAMNDKALEELNKEFSQLKEDIAAAEVDMKKIKETLKKAKDCARQTAESLNKQIAAVESQKSCEQSALNQLQSAIDNSESKNLQLSKTIASLKDCRDKCKLTDSNANLKNILKNEETKKIMLEQEEAVQRSKLNDFKTQLDSVKAESDSMITEMKKKMNALQEEKNKLGGEITSQTKNIAALEKKTKIVSKMVDQTQEALDDLKDDGSESEVVTPTTESEGVDCSSRDKATKGDDIWCACNIKKAPIAAQEDCENPGGGRADVCQWTEGSCVPKSANVETTVSESDESETTESESDESETTEIASTEGEVEPGCTKKGFMPCGTGLFGKPIEKTFGGVKHCCPAPKSPEKVKEQALPAGNTCVKKRPFKGACSKETNLVKLFTQCLIHAKKEKAPMFVIYPPDANEKSSNCWLCEGEETRQSKMKKAFLFKTDGSTPAQETEASEEPVAPSDGKKCCRLPGAGVRLYNKCPPQGKEVARKMCAKRKLRGPKSKAKFLEISEH